MDKKIITKSRYVEEFDDLEEIIQFFRSEDIAPKDVTVISVDYEGPWFSYQALENDSEYEKRLERIRKGEECI